MRAGAYADDERVRPDSSRRCGRSSPFCAEDPVERVFLEDVARRGLGRFAALAANGTLTALCHVGANVVPSGVGCGAFGRAAASSRARMVIGEEHAVDELWDAAGAKMPDAARGPAGAARLRARRAA